MLHVAVSDVDPDDETQPVGLRAAALYQRGVQTKVIADRLGLHRTSVLSAAKAYGVATRPPYSPYVAMNPQTRTAILAAAKRGEYARQIARGNGISVSTVLRVIREEGLPVHPRCRPRKLGAGSRARIVREYIAGASTVQIAADLGVHYGTVSRVLREEGVEIRGRHPRQQPSTCPHG